MNRTNVCHAKLQRSARGSNPPSFRKENNLKPDSESLLNEISAAFEEYVHAKSEHENIVSRLNAVDALNDVFMLIINKTDVKRGLIFQMHMIDLAQDINNRISALLTEIRLGMDEED